MRRLAAALGGLIALSSQTSPALHAQATTARVPLIHRARVWNESDIASKDLKRGPDVPGAFAPRQMIACRYVEDEFQGRSPKFTCLTESGEKLKVKYGRSNGEVYGEVAATRLLWALGFGADAMFSVRVLCTGCPAAFAGRPAPGGAQRFDPAAVERRLPGKAVESGDRPGWSWLELDLIDEDEGGSPRAHRDALKLLAAFLQHTDTKPEQQRLLCLDGPECETPFMLLNDVGLTFGRANLANANAVGSVNLEEWSRTPVWKGSRGCVGNLPRSLTGTLKEPIVSEEGRRFLSGLLARLSNRQIRDLFEGARMDERLPAFPGGGEPAGVDQWVEAFTRKREEIDQRRCLDGWWSDAPAGFQTGTILWLQSHASTPLTIVANVVSLFGYTRAYMAIAVALALGFRLRAGAALLLLLALTGVFTDGAKAIVTFPRPDAVDDRVATLTMFRGSFAEPRATRSIDVEDGYGFPSGHVAATTAFLFGLVFLFGWNCAWVGMAIWLPVMAVSRLYLGRHFPGDILGGVAIGVIATATGMLGLVLARLKDASRAYAVALRVLGAASGLAVLALWSGIPATYDTGRFLGLALGVVMLGSTRIEEDLSALARLGRIALAASLFAGAWWITGVMLEATELSHTPIGGLLAGALPLALVLPGPIWIQRVLASALQRQPERAGPG